MTWIDSLNFCIATFALIYTFLNDRNTKRSNTYEDVFEHLLIKDLPKWVSRYESTKNEEDFERLCDILLEIAERNLVFTYLDAKVYKTIATNVIKVEDCVVWCQSNKDKNSKRKFIEVNNAVGCILKTVYKL